MLTSRRSRSKNALTLVALSAFCAQASGAGRKPDDYVGRARQLIRTLYPGLDGRLQPVIIGLPLREPDSIDPDAMNFFDMELYGPETKPAQAPAACWCAPPVLRAHFTFDWQTESKELIDLSVHGLAVHGRNDKFGEEVEKHPEWSDARVAAALKEAGARYGPDHRAEFLRALPLEKLRPFMGGEIEVASAEFNTRAGSAGDGPYWFVRARWHSPDGRVADCTLVFEPFEGNLQSISRMPLLPKEEPGQ